MPSHRNDQESVDEQPVDAIAMLKADHQRVKDLFAQYEGTSNADAKGALADEVFVELETHAQLEENIFYPSLNEETEEGPELVKESLHEHAAVKQLIAELRQMGPQNNGFDAKFHELYDTRPAKLLFIKSAPNRRYGDVVEAMDIARGAGVQVIGFTPAEGQAKPAGQ